MLRIMVIWPTKHAFCRSESAEIELLVGDITKIAVDAIVNAANSALSRWRGSGRRHSSRRGARIDARIGHHSCPSWTVPNRQRSRDRCRQVAGAIRVSHRGPVYRAVMKRKPNCSGPVIQVPGSGGTEPALVRSAFLPSAPVYMAIRWRRLQNRPRYRARVAGEPTSVRLVKLVQYSPRTMKSTGVLLLAETRLRWRLRAVFCSPNYNGRDAGVGGWFP